jgi:N6-adenosine-specific RNA methylase IME4
MEFNNFPDKKYDLIVVDPPWGYAKPFGALNSLAKDWPYKTISIEEIASLPIKSISHDTSIIFLWTTQKYLFECKDLIEKWGFNYTLCMTWKKTFGISAGVPMKGFKFNSEFIVVGSVHKIPPISKKGIKLIPCSFEAPNLGHSIKPQEFYTMIEHLGETRIDLFARKERDGWDVWGDEI